jgi:parallel beta-helix repeat protein
VEDNEIDHNRGVGVLLRDGSQSAVTRNRVYANGYGVVVVFGDPVRPDTVAENLVFEQVQDGLYVIAGAPVLRANEVRGNGAAGLRIHDFAPLLGARRAAAPLLQGNVFTGNTHDEPERGVYRERGEERQRGD